MFVNPANIIQLLHEHFEQFPSSSSQISNQDRKLAERLIEFIESVINLSDLDSLFVEELILDDENFDYEEDYECEQEDDFF